MRKILLLFALIVMSCSSDDGNNGENDIDPIIGEWKFVSENDYYCGTHTVSGERLADESHEEKRFVFKSDGTYGNYTNGVITEQEDQKGTWEKTELGDYLLLYKVYGEQRSSREEVLFDGDLMRFGVNDPCVEIGGNMIYIYRVYERQ